MQRFISFLVFLPFAPVLLLMVLAFRVYRQVLSYILRVKHGDSFVGMLDGRDAMWGLEEHKNCGVVNIVAFVEDSAVKGEDDLPEKLRGIFVKRFATLIEHKRDQYRKGLLKRNRAFGYYYWTDDLNIKAGDYIRLVEPKSRGVNLSELEIQELAGRITTANLPYNHSALWEIVVFSKPILDDKRNVLKYPVFLRFHHSMGDGVAILRFVMEEIMNPTEMWKFSPKVDSKPGSHQTNNLSVWLNALYEFPAHIIRILLIRSDKNSLDTNNISPHKMVCWQNERSVCKSLRWLPLLEKIQTRQSGVAYSSVFLTALSGTLHKYFDARGEHPGALTIALPIRMKHEEVNLKLENAFATPMERIPLKPCVQLDDPSRQQKLINNLAAMKQTTKILRSTSNLLITHLITISLAAAFPMPILKYLSKLFHITASVSAMPMLKKNLQVGPYELKDMIFWPPAFGSVGLNFSLFVYGNQLQLALLADGSVLGTVQEGMDLLEEIMHEIERMDTVMGE
ncbi:uncharacterized protein LOC109426046 [Aedes albopictus]|uniref:O-acyltransferase WSD1 C-terminal domain-containing protein n=1 Tax=Aedes albopictus TaxID=7160 RepID=A0ABM1Y1S4_AEDAL